MPEVLHHQTVDTAVHDATGAVKLYTDADDHLNRLFAADKAEIPWWISLYENIHDLIKPEKLPPLVITSRPVAVKSIWGLYAPKPKSFYSSSAALAVIFTLLMVGFTSKTVQKKLAENFNLVDPNIKPYIPPKKDISQGGGGGGAREIPPVSKGQAPKPSLRQFTPPMIVKEQPKLAMTPTIIAPPDVVLPQNNLPN